MGRERFALLPGTLVMNEAGSHGIYLRLNLCKKREPKK